ncbi:hypothetical protein MTO96_038870 [Rhipicephalus appendiculatus]
MPDAHDGDEVCASGTPSMACNTFTVELLTNLDFRSLKIGHNGIAGGNATVSSPVSQTRTRRRKSTGYSAPWVKKRKTCAPP